MFEDGVFKPVERPKLDEGDRVRLTVETFTKTSPEDVLSLATRVFAGFTLSEIEEIEGMTRRRPLFRADP